MPSIAHDGVKARRDMACLFNTVVQLLSKLVNWRDKITIYQVSIPVLPTKKNSMPAIILQ